MLKTEALFGFRSVRYSILKSGSESKIKINALLKTLGGYVGAKLLTMKGVT